MATSFIGLTVLISLNSGQDIRGIISAVDPTSGNLSVYNAYDASHFNVNRSQIKDLQLIQQTQTNQHQHQQQQHSITRPSSPPSSQPQPPVDPAILSMSSTNNSSFQSNHQASNVHAPFIDQSRTQSQSAPTSSNLPQISPLNQKNNQNQSQNQNQIQIQTHLKVKKDGEEKEKGKKNASGKSNENPNSNTSGNPNGIKQNQHQNQARQVSNQSKNNETQSHTNGKGKSKAKNGGGSNVNGKQNGNSGGGGFDEDFDFDAGLKTFNKKAVWEEIRNADQSDKSSLLVSHNRVGSSRGGDSPSPAFNQRRQLTKDGRNGQMKLAPNENVLSPEPEEREYLSGLEDGEEFLLGNLNIGESVNAQEHGEDDEEEEEDQEEEFMEALSSPSPANLSRAKNERNGIHSTPLTTRNHPYISQAPSSVSSSSNLTSNVTKSQTQTQNPIYDQSNFLSSSNDNDNLFSSSQNGWRGTHQDPNPNSTSKSKTKESSLLREIKELKEKISLLESISCLSLNLNPSLKSSNAEPGSSVYECQLLEGGKGARFNFSLACSFDQSDEDGVSTGKLNRLRYLPSRLDIKSRNEKDDTEGQEMILERLPNLYSKEIGLRPENAGIFIKRLKDSLAGGDGSLRT